MSELPIVWSTGCFRIAELHRIERIDAAAAPVRIALHPRVAVPQLQQRPCASAG